jgi:hypothetical protein
MQRSEKCLGLGGFAPAFKSDGADFMDLTLPFAPNWARTANMPWGRAAGDPSELLKAEGGILKERRECLNK